MAATKKSNNKKTAASGKKSAAKSSVKSKAKTSAGKKTAAKVRKPAPKASAKKPVKSKKAIVKKPAAKTTKKVVKKVAAKPKAKTSKPKVQSESKIAKTASFLKNAMKLVMHKKPKAVTTAKKPVAAVATKPKSGATVTKITAAKKPPIMKTEPVTKTMAVTQKVTAVAETKHKVVKKIMADVAARPVKASDLSGISFLGIEPYALKDGEEYMNARQRDYFRMLLEKWKTALMEEVDRTMHHMKDEAENFADPNDRASQDEQFSLELRTRDRERKLIKKISEGLNRIETNEYGYCEACGVEIGIRRLEARPTATLCIDCKTMDEIREKQTRV